MTDSLAGGKLIVGCHDEAGENATESSPLVAISRHGIEDVIQCEIKGSERINSYRSGSVVKDGALGCLRYCFRIHVPMIPIIMAILLLTTRFARVPYYPYASLVPSTNTQKIAKLEKSLGSSLELLENAAVATDHGACSQVGKNILVQGGNAVDAAVASTLCLGVASPASSGLGGGAFILVRMKKSDFEQKQGTVIVPEFIDARTQNKDSNSSNFMTEVIDCREVAPEKASRDMYAGLPNRASMAGGLAIAVPGEVSRSVSWNYALVIIAKECLILIFCIFFFLPNLASGIGTCPCPTRKVAME